MSDQVVTTVVVDTTSGSKNVKELTENLKNFSIVIKTTNGEFESLERSYNKLTNSSDGVIRSVDTLKRSLKSLNGETKDEDPAYLKLHVKAVGDIKAVAKEVEKVLNDTNSKIVYKNQLLTEDTAKSVESRIGAEKANAKASQKLLDERLAYAKNIQKQLSDNLKNALNSDGTAQSSSVRKINAQVADETLRAQQRLKDQLKNINASLTSTSDKEEIKRRSRTAYESAEQTILAARNSGREQIRQIEAVNSFATSQQEIMNRNLITSAAQREGGRRAAIQEQADHEYAIRQNLASRIAALNSQVSSGALTSAAAQQRISEAFRQTTQEINQSRSALESHVTMHESLASKVFKMIGLYRVFNFAIESTLNFLKSIPAAGIEMQSTISALHASFSVDPRNLQTNTKLGENLTVKAMEMLRNEADRTGISLVTLETNYRSFLASAHLAGESTDTVNSIFKNLNTTITALHMTSDRAQLTFLALAQMFNKGKIQSEELVKQLGNLLPGAFAAFAKANGLKTQELIKQMKAGAVQAHETVAKFAEFYAKNYADAFTKAASGLNAELGRMETAWTNLSRGLFGVAGGAIGAVVSGFTDLLNILTPTETTIIRINQALDWYFKKLEDHDKFKEKNNFSEILLRMIEESEAINKAIFKGQQGTIDYSNRFDGVKLSSAPLNVQQRLVEEELTKQALFINKFEEELKTKQASGSYAESYMKKNADLLSKAKSDMEMLVALNNHLVDLDKNLDKKNALSGFDETHNAAIEKLDEQLFRNVKAYEMEIGVLEGLLKKQGGKFAPEFNKDGSVNHIGLTESKWALGHIHANDTLLASVDKRREKEEEVLETIAKQVEKYKELGEKIKATLAEEEARKTKAAKEMGTGKKEDLEQETLKLYQTNKEIESTIEKLKALEGQTLKTASAYKDVVTGSASVAATGLNLNAPAVLEPNLKKLVQGNLNSIANPKNQKFVELISSMAAARGIDRELALAMVAQESKFNPNATSPANAHGLMQMIPATAGRYGVTNAFDPVDNIKGGLKYLADLLKMFKGNVSLALAGYNAGEGAVKKYGNQIPPYKETQNYEKIITATISSLKTQLPAPKDTSVVVKEPPLLIRRPDLQTPEEIKAENAEKAKGTEQLYDQLKALQKKAELSREVIDELTKEKKLRFEIDEIFSTAKEETVFDAQKTLDVEGFIAGTATIKREMEKLETAYRIKADEGNFLDRTIPQLKAKLKELGSPDSETFKQQSKVLEYDIAKLKEIEKELPKIVQQYGGLKEVLKDSAKEMEKLAREQQKILNAPIKDLQRQILKASMSNKSGYLDDVWRDYVEKGITNGDEINAKLKEAGRLWEELQQTLNEKNLYEGFVSNFQSGFSEVIQNGKEFGATLTEIFDSSISTILNNSLKDLVDGFTDAFSNIAGASEGAWEKVGASLFKIGISAVGSWLKSSPKESKPSASADVQLPATGLSSFKQSDLFSRSTSTAIASTVSANYNAQLEKVISLAYSNSSSIVGFIGNVGTKLSSMSTVASTTFTAIGNFLKPVTSLISSGYSYLVDIGTKATTYFGSLFTNGATKTLETAGASATSKLPYIGAAISVLKAGYDIYKTATDDQAALGTQIANSMYAVSDALTVLATTNIWNPAGWVGLAAAAATSVVGSISDIIDGDAKRGIYSLAGSVIGSFTLGIYGALIGGMFGRLFTPVKTPNSWINGFNSLGTNYSPAEMNKYTPQAPGYKDIGDNVYQRGTNKGLFLGTNTRLGSVELSYHEIPRKTAMEELDNSFKALLIYYKLVNDQIAESLSVMDDANNETGQTLVKFLGNLGDGAEKNRIVFKQELSNFNSADSAEFYYEKIGERLIATGTRAGKIWGTVYKNLSAAWVNISDQSSVFTFDSALVANNIATNFSTLGLQVIDDLTSKLSVVKAGGKREDIQKQLEGNFGTYFKITSFLSDPKFGIQASFNTETISGMIKAWNTFSQDIEGLGEGFISFASLVQKSNPGLSKEAFLPTVQAIQTGVADKFISKGYTGEQALSLTNSSVLGASSLSSMGVGNSRLLAGGIAFAEAAAKKASQTLLEANASIDAAIEKGKKEGILNEKMSKETQLAILVNTKALDAKTISEANFSIQQAQANKTYLEGYDLVSGVIAGLRSSFDGFGLTVETLPQVIDNITNAFGDLKTAAQTAENTIATLFGEKAVAQQKLETGTSLQKSILNELPENIRNQLGLSGGMTSKQVQETIAAQAIKNNVTIQDLLVGAFGNAVSSPNSIVNRFAAATGMVDAGNGLTPGQAFQTGKFDVAESSADLENKAKENRKSFLEKQASVYKEISSLTAGEFERTFIDIDSYINDLAESVKELNEGSLTGLETLKNLKYQEAFKPLKDELDSIGKSDAQKAFDRVNQDINDIYNTVNSRTDATPILESLNKIKASRIAEIAKPIVELVDGLVKSASRLKSSDFETSLFSILDKAETDFKTLAENPTTTWNQAKSAMDSTIALAANAYEKAAKDLEKLYNQIAKSIRVASESVQDALFDIRYKTAETILNSQVGNLLNSTDPNVRSSAGQIYSSGKAGLISSQNAQDFKIFTRAFNEFNNSVAGETFAESIDRQISGITKVQSLVQTRYNREMQNIQEILSASNAIGEKLKSLRLDSNLSILSPKEQFAEALQQYQSDSSLAKAGNKEALTRLPSAIDVLLNLGKTFLTSGSEYRDLFDYVMSDAGQFNLTPENVQEKIRIASEEANTYLSNIETKLGELEELRKKSQAEETEKLQNSLKDLGTQFSRSIQKLLDGVVPGNQIDVGLYASNGLISSKNDVMIGKSAKGNRTNTDESSLLLEEVKRLREAIEKQNKLEDERTGDVILSNYDALDKSTSKLSKDLVSAIEDIGWKNKIAVTLD